MAEGFLEICGIKKNFGSVQALKGVTFSIEKGEIHALLGENGAGKSTLIKIVMGELKPDAGTIKIEGVPFSTFSVDYSRKRGIAMVHQELAVFENMTVAENIFPTDKIKTKYGLINLKALNQKANESISKFGIDISADQELESLTLAQQQVVEILRAISNNNKIILLDEPTSGLNHEETARLMDILKQLKEEGITIIYISHRISEIMQICDKITVLRDGRYEGTFDNDGTLTEEKLINSMVGREFSSSLYTRKDYHYQQVNKDVIWEIKGLTKQNSVQDISFQLGKGEILGIYGLEGSGVHEVSRMIYGLQNFDHCEMIFKGEKISRITPTNLIKKKIVYLNTNRKLAGLLLSMTAVDNISTPILDKNSKITIINKKGLRDKTRKFIKEFGIKIASLNSKAKSLSGGNQQKLMLATCLAVEPEVLIINSPTRGIDIGAKEEIHQYILKSVEKGMSVILISAELPELLRLSDRLLIMQNKRLKGELIATEISEESAMALASIG